MNECRRVRLHYTRDVIQQTAESLALLSLFSLRALVCSRREDVVVIPGDVCPEELPLLNELGLGPAPANVHADLSRLGGEKVLPFSGTSTDLRRMADEAGCPLDAPPLKTCQLANDKGELYRLCGADPLARLPLGWACAPAEVEDAVRRLHARGSAARIKATCSASGLNQSCVRVGEEVVLPDRCDPKPEEFVVQEEIDGDFDASVQFLVRRDGFVDLPAVTGQYVKDGGSHYGNFVPSGLPRPIVRAMRESTRHIVGSLVADSGFFGAGSVDFIGSRRTGQVYALEVNARVTAPFYPMMASKRLFKDTVRPFDMRSFAVPKGLSVVDLSKHFKEVLFRREEGKGFVPFNVLSAYGFAYGVAFAQTPSDLATLVLKVERLKAELSA